jgi:hypothetical protein
MTASRPTTEELLRLARVWDTEARVRFLKGYRGYLVREALLETHRDFAGRSLSFESRSSFASVRDASILDNESRFSNRTRNRLFLFWLPALAILGADSPAGPRTLGSFPRGHGEVAG